jgi:hypothetical protein
MAGGWFGLREKNCRLVADKPNEQAVVIGPSQSAFLPGRYILDGAVILHETLHELKKKKLDGVVLIIDFEKAYDKVNWHFLQ